MSTINECAKQDSKEIKNSLKISMVEGGFAAAMQGFTQDYFTPCLLFSGGTITQVGMLAALPNLLASVFQLKSADYTNHLRSRNKIISICVILQILSLLLLPVTIYFKLANPLILIVIVTLFTVFGGFSAPAWSSLISDLVADNKRGIFFGQRNKIVGLSMVGLSLLAGLILQIFKHINLLYGFIIIFSLAALFRAISWKLLTLMHESSTNETKEDHFTFYEFISRLGQSNFAKFVIFVSLFNFSVFLSAPFFAVLMLKELSFSYILYIVITSTANLVMYLTMERWGRYADHTGNLKVIKLTSIFISFVPLLWVINRNPVCLILFQILSGFVWAGFNLAILNFIFDAVSPAKRTRCISYFNFLNGTAICLGALLGGYILKYLPKLLGSHILALFVLSTVVRLFICLYFPKKLKEVRAVKDIQSSDLFFSVLGLRPGS